MAPCHPRNAANAPSTPSAPTCSNSPNEQRPPGRRVSPCPRNVPTLIRYNQGRALTAPSRAESLTQHYTSKHINRHLLHNMPATPLEKASTDNKSRMAPGRGI
jgi:hypothetical protein